MFMRGIKQNAPRKVKRLDREFFIPTDIFALYTGGIKVYTNQHSTIIQEIVMAQKKKERKKELDRRRHRRAQRIKERIHAAQAAAKEKKA